MHNSSNRTAKNFIWKFAERLGTQGVTFVVSVILARLLEPEVYGTLALVTVFITLMGVFVDSGMGNALIQKKDADDTDFSSVFYLNMVLGILLYAIMYTAAPAIAWFYASPEITSVLRVLSLLLPLAAISNIQGAYLSKHLQFQKAFFSNLGSTVASAIVGIWMAYAGYGIWALVGQQLVGRITSVIILWFTVRWRPKLLFSFKRVKSLFTFGGKILACNLLDNAYSSLRQMIIGKKYTSSDLAYYNKGEHFPRLIVLNIDLSIEGILLPTMAQVQDDIEKLKEITRSALKISTYCIAPLMLGLVACAEPLVKLLLTEKWMDSVLFMRVFCINYLFHPFFTINPLNWRAQGEGSLCLRIEVYKRCVGIVIMLVTMWISVEAMAYGILVSTLLLTIINAFPNKKLLNYSWAEQMKDILPNIGMAAAMAVPVYFLGFLPLPTALVLTVQVLSGAAIYVGLSVALKVDDFALLWGIVKQYFGKRKL